MFSVVGRLEDFWLTKLNGSTRLDRSVFRTRRGTCRVSHCIAALILTMKLLSVASLILLLFAFSLEAAATKKQTTAKRKWRNLQVASQRSILARRKLPGTKESTGGVRGEKKDPEDAGKGSSKTKLGKMDKCNRDRRSLTVVTSFDTNSLNEVEGQSVSGFEFNFTGEYTGSWTQATVVVSDGISLGHDHLTFYDDDKEFVGILTTQFDDESDYATVTGGFGEFACAHGSPTVHFPEEGSTMVDVVWDLCVCYH